MLQHADVAYFFGMIDTEQRITAMTQQLAVAQLVADGVRRASSDACSLHLHRHVPHGWGNSACTPSGAWPEAHRQREALLQYLTDASGVGTLLDHRRFRDYDADKNAERYCNQAPVKVPSGHLPFAAFSSAVHRRTEVVLLG